LRDSTLTEHLDFLLRLEGQDEATLLAKALRTGIETLYREALVEAYLRGETPREAVLNELGSDALDEIEFQRDALRRDFEWGLQGA
jgi:hypothetical protein